MAKTSNITMDMESPKTIKRTYGYEYKFQTAESFYYTLLNFKDIMIKGLLPYKAESYRSTRWVFRGQWNKNLKLLPKAFRKGWHTEFRAKPLGDILIRLRQEYLKNNQDTKNNYLLMSQIRTEHLLLKEFMDTANDLGIECNYTPSIHDYEKTLRQALQQALRKSKFEEFEKWPNDNSILSAMALAQHHGIPTRLLDFTYNPLFAAFFAAIEPFEKSLDKESWDTDLCVWAFEEKNISLNSWEKISVPINRTSNLFAQKSVLILDPTANKNFIETEGKWQDLIVKKESGCFIKLTLPQSECIKLLYRLWRNDITPARIKPNLDSVNETLKYIYWLRKNN